ncbi:hypothetical protein [Ruminococcus sp.]|uniref:hypothetical protein n=1 Tax=Ruminococcus sp. TaxID=41978 RepID=UPI003F090E78
MCEWCAQLPLTKQIFTPRAYEEIIACIKELVEQRQFILVKGSCPLGQHRRPDGSWVGDVIFHTIQCPRCGELFTCSVDTYHGGGSFRQGE